jgi:hypothetical protein
MDAARFWRDPGIIAGVQRYGFEVLALPRLHRPADWKAEVGQLAPVGGLRRCKGAAVLVLVAPLPADAVTREACDKDQRAIGDRTADLRVPILTRPPAALRRSPNS